ncbi:MAG TPA: gliding motility-associated C-terminal domain-containing protein [Saprospiraceae bacterium]|nr:gliding motility-associated C-terminal domain-containing protein [Saprospiraceae bacterium]HPI05195.1 gliding motility-associated C-terminal domain-containing protein [Saprospiraceae bacterium]
MSCRVLRVFLWALLAVHSAAGQSFQKEYQVAGSSLVIPYSVAQRPDGNFLVAHLVREDSLRMHVSCIGTSGEVLWSTRLHAHFSGDNASEGIKKTPVLATADNGCVMLVSKSLVTTGQGWAIVKLSANGTVQWTRYITGVGSVDDLLGYAGGRIYVLARYWSFDSKPFMACLDDNGNVIWEQNVQAHLDNIVSTGLRVLPDQRILLMLAESSFLQQTGHVARLNTDGSLTPILSLPNLSLLGVDEHPDGRLFFMARTLDSINLKNQVLLGSALNGQLQYLKVLDIPQDFYYAGMLALNTVKDSFTVTFRASFFESQRFWIRFDLNGNPGAAHYIPSETTLNNEVIPLLDGGFAWLSANSITGSLTSFVLARSNPQARLETCPAGVLCGMAVRDTFFPTTSVSPWAALPVSRIIPGNTIQTPRSVTVADYCNPLPLLDASIAAGDSTVCDAEPFTFNRLPAASGISYWTFPGAAPGTFLGAEPPDIVFPYAGTFEVRHILNQAGCLDTAELDVRVSDYPAFSIPADTVLCSGQPVVIGVQPMPGSMYHWNDDYAQPFRNIETAGIYSLTVTNAEACSNSDSIRVHLPELPAALVQPDTFFCAPLALTLTLNSEPGWQYAWADGGGGTERVFSEPGIYYLQAESPEHCAVTDSVVIVRRQAPEVFIAAAQPYECGARNLEARGNTLQFFRWSNAETSAGISAHESGLYTLTVSDGFCESADSMQVEILPCPECSVYIPGVFKPASGIGFQVQSGCAATEFDLRMYDRWGNLLFESRDADMVWNGEWRGRFLPPGVYVYQLKMTLFSGDAYFPFAKTGDVSIVR